MEKKMGRGEGEASKRRREKLNCLSRSPKLDIMLLPRCIQRPLASQLAKRAELEPLISLSAGPSFLTPADQRQRAVSTGQQVRSRENKHWKPTANKRFHFRPIHLFVAVIGLMLAAQVPAVRERRSFAFLDRVEATGDADSAQQYVNGPLMVVDSKFWIRDMEFGERDNWRAGLKPCTLTQRIAIDQEAAVISLGDSMDALGGAGIEANIRELTLAPDGVLLMEEDTVSVGPVDPYFVQYLNQSGDCYDSSFFANSEGPPAAQPQFHFEPDSDAMSWFNPDNWHSTVHTYNQIGELMMDSHRIPCSDEVVVFGSRQYSFWPTVMGNERAKTLTFKVNFRAAQADESLGKNSNISSMLPSLRVSKLEINQHSYSQAEFDQLTDLYDNHLFQFHDERSVFGDKFRSDGRQDMLVIDSSSIRQNNDDMMDLCLDEAGCVCGNEHPDIMRVICSFRQPLKPHDLPCRDPIQVIGYCDKVCATSIAIAIVPELFKESFLINDLIRLEQEMAKDQLGEHVFIGQRRVDHDRYEIVIRLVPASDSIYEQILGREIEFAERIKMSLERPAIKSFYGIRSISIRSSIDWRRNSQSRILFSVFAIASSIFISMFVYNDEMFPIKALTRLIDSSRVQIIGGLFTSYRHHEGFSRDSSFLGEPVISDQDGSVREMPLDYLKDADSVSVSLDTHSVTESIQCLIEPES